MIRISRVGALAGVDAASLGSGSVFLADERLARALEGSGLRERIAAAAADAPRSIVWVDAGQRLTTLALDADGRVLRPLALPHGLAIAPGAAVDVRDPGVIVVRPADSGARAVRLPLEGPAAGALHYRGPAEADASIRYFHPLPPAPGAAAASTPLAAIRFRVFAAGSAGPGAADVRHDPARPYDPAHSRAVPLAPGPRPSAFRTRWGGVLTLAELPPHSAYVQAWDPVLESAYTTLDGIWAWAVEGGGAGVVELMAGFSGAEYVRAPGSWVLRFVAGAPAYAHRFAAAGAPAAAAEGFPLVSRAPGVPDEVTTAWLYVQAPRDEPLEAPAGYFSQPDRAPLFTPGPTGSLLRALSLQAAPLPPDPPPGPAPSPSFPAAPYAGLETGPAAGPDATALERLRRFESEVLAAARTSVIYGFPAAGPRGLASSPAGAGQGAGPLAGALGVSGPSGPTGPTGPVQTAVTPQGMLSAFTPGFESWRELVLAQNAGERLVYTEVHGRLREALLANQLFLVVSDPAKLYEHCSTIYRVTDVLVQRLLREKAPEAVVRVARRLAGYPFYARDYFVAELRRQLGEADFEAWEKKLVPGAEQAQLTLGGWTFDLASASWSAGEAPTLLILKFGDGDLRSLAGDLSRWTLPDAFNASPTETQGRLVRFLDQAVERAPREPELQPFVRVVLGDGADGRGVWNGVLYLNPAVPTNAFPPEIAALAAGLPQGPLRAHHLGVTLSSFAVRGGVVRIDDSSLFGLILYDDPADLVFEGAPYDFKVLSLRVRFANSSLASFTSQVELLVARLFGEPGTLRDSLRGNNLLLDGTLQKGAYRFSSASRSRFALESRVLDQVTVARARFVTVPGETAGGRTVARFILDGSMGFRRLGDFDLFGFGPAENGGEGGQLVFSNLFVSMEFDPADPGASRRFGFVAGQMSLDAGSSRARPESLPRRFPLRAAAMRQGGRVTDAKGQEKVAMPPDLGFIPVESPLGEGGLGEEWYGLEMTLGFGSPGALAPSLGFSGALLAAWSPAADAPNVAVGIRLPGSEGGKKTLTVMGPLKLGIGRLAFLWDPSTRGYLLRLQNVALSFLGLSFPPGGRTNALLFGDPDPRAGNPALGWYLAYKKDEKKKDEKMKPVVPVRALPAPAPGADADCPPCREAAEAAATRPPSGG